jgi:excisionase family DNA binding protein
VSGPRTTPEILQDAVRALNNDQPLTPLEVSALMRVDPKTVTRWGAAGRLRSIKTPGGHRRYPAEVVRQMMVASGLPVPNAEPAEEGPEGQEVWVVIRTKDGTMGSLWATEEKATARAKYMNESLRMPLWGIRKAVVQG